MFFIWSCPLPRPSSHPFFLVSWAQFPNPVSSLLSMGTKQGHHHGGSHVHVHADPYPASLRCTANLRTDPGVAPGPGGTTSIRLSDQNELEGHLCGALGASPSCNPTDEAAGVKAVGRSATCPKAPQAHVIQENFIFPTITAGKRGSLPSTHQLMCVLLWSSFTVTLTKEGGERW